MLLLTHSARSDPFEIADPKKVLVKVDPVSNHSSQPKNFWPHPPPWGDMHFSIFDPPEGGKTGEKFSWSTALTYQNAFCSEISTFQGSTNAQKEFWNFQNFYSKNFQKTGQNFEFLFWELPRWDFKFFWPIVVSNRVTFGACWETNAHSPPWPPFGGSKIFSINTSPDFDIISKFFIKCKNVPDIWLA